MNTSSLTPTHRTLELVGWVESQCQRMIATVDGLTDAQLRAVLSPSGWSMLGLLGHVRDSTVFWLHHVVLGEPAPMDEEPRWDDDPAVPGSEVVAGFTTTCASACAAVRHVPADTPPGWWPDGAWGGYRQHTVTGVLLHLLAENAAHAGHLDIARELTDGAVWDLGADAVRVPSR
ncbi:MAG: DUF664 domain-containing protein [Phycicoccus sp.]